MKRTIITALLLAVGFVAGCDPLDPCWGLRPLIEQECAAGDAEQCMRLQSCF